MKRIVESSDCPCSYPVDPSGCPVENGAGAGWLPPSTDTHKGGSFEIRSKPTATGSGQQCVYDSAGQLINDGPGAGTPDIVSPPSTKFGADLRRGNLSNIMRRGLHFLFDGTPYYLVDLPLSFSRYGDVLNAFLGTTFDHWTHPPNQGCDDNGNPCPINDGTANPPKPGGLDCCKDK